LLRCKTVGGIEPMTSKRLLFGNLFFGLREAGIPVNLSEWLTLMEALAKGVVAPNLTDFYRIARAILVKHEAHFDTYDLVFAAVFADGEMPESLESALLEWLENPIAPPQLSAEEVAALEQMPVERLRELFEQRLREQNERHDGGSHWVGTGGTSPFGHGGRHPAGIRVGGEGGGRSAVQIASERRFRQYRHDRVLDTRAIAMALKRLRRLTRTIGDPELDVEGSIEATSRNAGMLTLEFHPPRKNEARVLLLMDVGGSMDPHAHLVERLFSAAHGLNHWRHFEALCFHNAPYETLWTNETPKQPLETAELLLERAAETFLIFVGDASMAPSELSARYGAIDYWHRNETPGIVWLHRLRSRFKRCVWLNPLPEHWWGGYTTHLIQRLIPMFPLTVAGLDEAISSLMTHAPMTSAPLDASFASEYDNLFGN
jgi:uncharacterized protein with von Willebrand factor type A (vWA) domain